MEEILLSSVQRSVLNPMNQIRHVRRSFPFVSIQETDCSFPGGTWNGSGKVIPEKNALMSLKVISGHCEHIKWFPPWLNMPHRGDQDNPTWLQGDLGDNFIEQTEGRVGP
jgi:hypothetical protein